MTTTAKIKEDGRVRLTMTREAADSLRSLIGWNVGGTLGGTYRDDMHTIYLALIKAGLRHVEQRFDGMVAGKVKA
jgi:hypothetical protein